MNFCASTLWSSVSLLPRVLIRFGLIKPKVLDGVRVISIGNIQVGGAGKTPLVAHLAREAISKGRVTAILTRGYGGQWEKTGGVISPQAGAAPENEGQDLHPWNCGDETLLLHELVPQAWIGVGADRVRSFETLRERIDSEKSKPLELVILDDGFQHYKLKKDVEVVALTSYKRTERIFRDFESSLKRADLVVWTKGNDKPGYLKRHPEVPFAKTRYALEGPQWDKPYWFVSGIADSRLALDQLKRAGYRILRHIAFPDHARYSERIVHQLIADADRNGVHILLTGKDWVKWRALGIDSEHLKTVEPQIEFEEGEDRWRSVLWPS